MAGNSETATCLQSDEIEHVKRSFQGQVRVISGIGDFTHVVTIHPDGLDLHCKFQLTEAYPQTAPTISIRSSVLSADDTTSLTSYLQNEAASKLGHVMLAHIMATCKTWLKENGVDVTAITVTESSKDKKRKGKSKSVNKPKKLNSENEPADTFVKKPPMKTAADVIKRLQWDKGINKDDFIVGYMDRIIGLVEKRFTAFTWEDLASVDIHSLAIPQHRIQYFKYKTEIVWDKNERLDNVFGSTGSKLTIVSAVKKYEDKQEELGVEDSVKETKVDDFEHEDGACGRNTDDDIESNPEEGSVEQTDAHSTHTMASGRSYQRPNYFVALHINDTDTIQRLVEQQLSIISKYPCYTDFKTPPNGFHLTLALLKIDSMTDRQECVYAMNEAKPTLKHLANKAPPLSFRGVDHFNTKVVYAKVKFSREFRDLVDTINEILYNAGFQMDSSNFRPHLTLFKVTRSAYWNNDPNIALTCSHEVDTFFGSQAIDNIQVCKMGTLPVEEGSTEFYRNIFNMKIN